MIRLREGDTESLLTIDEFERRARRGEVSPFAMVCIPALTGEQFVQARELPLFVSLYDPRRIHFQRHFHLGRLPLLTGALALVAVALWWLALQRGGGAVTRDVLLALGAKARPRIIEDGETWRLLVANLLHRDVVHLGFNLFALLNIGTVLEGVYRRGDYVLLLTVSALATMTTSLALSGPVTVGASGLVFGCLGCAVVFGWRYSEVLPLRYRIYFGGVVVVYAGVMFYLGLRNPSTDNWGHTGGLLAGALMGMWLQPRLLRLKEAREKRRVTLLPWLVAAALVGLTVAVGPLVPRVFFYTEPYAVEAFGVVIERPAHWSKVADPLGFLAFGNDVDALASLACGRLSGPTDLNAAYTRFVDGELKAEVAAGSIAELEIGAPKTVMLGGGDRFVQALQLPIRFLAPDGPFDVNALLFVRGQIECALVLAHRPTAPAGSLARLKEIQERLLIVDTRAERAAQRQQRSNPKSVRLALELALAHQAAGDVDGARNAFSLAASLLKPGSSYNARLAYAWARFETDFGGDFDVARREIDRLAALPDSKADAALLRVDLLIAEQRHQEALRVAKAAQERFPDDTRLQKRARLLQQALSEP